MKHQNLIKGKRLQRGMTLVEVLIAAVVIAIGLLGVASLQINALQSTADAQNRSKATDVIAALADRVKANPFGVDAYNDAIPTDSCNLAPNASLPTIARCAMSPDGSASVVSSCTPAEMAAYDLWEINCDLQSTLPGALLNVTCPAPDCEMMSPMTVNITWQAQNRNPDEAASTPETTLTQSVVATILPEFHDE